MLQIASTGANSKQDTTFHSNKIASATPRASSILLAGVALTPIVVVTFTSSDTSLTIMSAIWLVAVSCISFLCARHPLDRTHPLLWSMSAMILMYVIHPFAMITSGQVRGLYQGRFYLTGSYTEALTLGLVGTIFLALGFGASMRGRRARVRPSPEFPTSPSTAISARRWAVTLTVLAFLGYGVFCVTAGLNPITELLNGARRGSVTTSSAYLYLSPQLLGPAALMSLYACWATHRSQWPTVLLCLVQIALFVPSGQRFVLLTSFVPVLLAAGYLYKRRLKIGAFTFLLFLALASLISLRDLGGSEVGLSIGESFARTISAPREALETFATGADTEMIDGLAVEIQYVPELLPHRPGYTAFTTLAAPIPSAVWPGKPVTFDGILNYRLLGVEKNNASVAYGFIGELFFDAGLLSVALGMLIFGLAFGRIAGLANTPRPLTFLVYIAAIPLTVSLLRGSLALIAGRSLFTFVPVLAFWWLHERQTRGSRAGKTRR